MAELKKRSWKEMETSNTILPSEHEWSLNTKIDAAVRRAWSQLSWAKSRLEEIERNLVEINDGKRDWVGSSTAVNANDLNTAVAELSALLEIRSDLKKREPKKEA